MKRLLSLLFFCLGAAPCILAQGGQPGADVDMDKLSQDIQNPLASLISVPFQNNLNYPIGPFNRYQNVLNIQPVIPIKLGSWNLLARAILPVVNRQDPLSKGGTRAGLGDLSATFFLSPARPGKLIWGIGPVLDIPTATASVLGTDKWSGGPSVVALVQPKHWTIGALVSNVWSFAGHGHTGPFIPPEIPQRFIHGTDEFIQPNQAINSFYTQYFITRQFEEGWFLTTSPIITGNWRLPSNEGWTVPFGGGLGRTFKIGHRPVMAQVQNFYNAIHPETLPHPNWQLRMEFVLMYPVTK